MHKFSKTFSTKYEKFSRFRVVSLYSPCSTVRNYFASKFMYVVQIYYSMFHVENGIFRTIHLCTETFKRIQCEWFPSMNGTFSSPSYCVWGTSVTVQIFNFRFLADLQALGAWRIRKNTKLAGCPGVR